MSVSANSYPGASLPFPRPSVPAVLCVCLQSALLGLSLIDQLCSPAVKHGIPLTLLALFLLSVALLLNILFPVEKTVEQPMEQPKARPVWIHNSILWSVLSTVCDFSALNLEHFPTVLLAALRTAQFLSISDGHAAFSALLCVGLCAVVRGTEDVLRCVCVEGYSIGLLWIVRLFWAGSAVKTSRKDETRATECVESQTDSDSASPAADEGMYKLFFNAFPHPAFVVDLNFDVNAAAPPVMNPAAESLVGRGTSMDRFFASMIMEHSKNTLSEFVRTRRRVIDKSVLKWDKAQGAGDSSERNVFEVAAATFDDEGDKRKLALVLIESPKDRKREKQLIEHFKTGLVCSLSHELCTPMNSLMPLLKMMPSKLTEDQKEDLKEIALSSAELLYSKIRDLVDYNKIEMSEFKLEDSEFAVTDLFQDLYKIFRFETVHKKNVLDFSIKEAENRKLFVLTDLLRLKQVLVKLINNANKYTNRGKVTVTASENDKNLDVRFAVSDSGVGMTRDTLNFIFASLSEKAKYVYRKCDGSTRLPGLGLVIAKRICECMGSTLQVESQPGKGTTFSFVLPTARIFPSAAEAHEPSPKNNASAVLEQRSFSMRKRRNTGQNKTSARDIPKPSRVTQINEGSRLSNVSEGSPEVCMERCLVSEDISRYMSIPMNGSKLVRTPKSKNTEIPIIIIRQEKTFSRPQFMSSGGLLKPPSSVRNSPRVYNTFTQVVGESRSLSTVALIADDIYGNRVVLREMLKKQGVATWEAVDGSEVVELVKKTMQHREEGSERIGLIFMDLNMPEMDGVQATQAIRELEKADDAGENQPIPIVAVTANNSEDDKRACLQAGMQDFVAKPVTFSILKTIVGKYFKSGSEGSK